MSILALFKQIEDPRVSGKVKHPLSTLLFTTFCAVLCGVESWNDIPDFCRAKYSWLSQYVSFQGGIPSEWTFRRIFTLLDPTILEALLTTHAKGLIEQKQGANQHLAIDGKVLRGSKRGELDALKLISAFSHQTGITLCQQEVGAKSNETAAIPLLLDMLELKGATLTIDAAGCQRSIAQKIIEKKGDYLLCLKKNHPKFYQAVSSYFQEQSIKPENLLKDYFDDKGGRLVRRRYFSLPIKAIEGAEQWAGLQAVIALETIRSQRKKDQVSSQVKAEWRYYLTSHKHTNPELADIIRNHWSIENKLHWVLDVHLGEDKDKKWERKSLKAFATLKRIALNIVRTKDSNPKRSLRRRFKLAGWDNDYLMSLLL